jgi:hypothetical protein
MKLACSLSLFFLHVYACHLTKSEIRYGWGGSIASAVNFRKYQAKHRWMQSSLGEHYRNIQVLGYRLMHTPRSNPLVQSESHGTSTVPNLTTQSAGALCGIPGDGDYCAGD